MEQELKMIRAADIEPKDVKWLWYPYIPFGKVTMIQGDPGDGKSTFVLDLLARLTRGDALPMRGEQHPPMDVIYQNTEDDPDDTVIPRFIKAGGDRSRLSFISEKEKMLTFTDRRIARAIQETKARVIVFDPLTSYIGGDVSINLANEVRDRINYLIAIARYSGCAVIVIGHMNKMAGSKALYRSLGSIDVVGSARSCMLIGRSKDDPANRIMAVQKCNLAERGRSIEFSVDDGRVEYLRHVEVTADELVGAFVSPASKGESKQQIAKRELLALLADGPMLKSDIISHMKELGVSQRTCELAKEGMPNVGCLRESGTNRSMWHLLEHKGTTQQQDFDTLCEESDGSVVPF